MSLGYRCLGVGLPLDFAQGRDLVQRQSRTVPTLFRVSHKLNEGYGKPYPYRVSRKSGLQLRERLCIYYM